MSEELVERIVRALKPPRCPYCGEKVEYLYYYVYELQRAVFSIDEYYQRGTYDDWDSCGCTYGDPDYCCPHCGETLFHSKEDAEKFLKGAEEDNEQ